MTENRSSRGSDIDPQCLLRNLKSSREALGSSTSPRLSNTVPFSSQSTYQKRVVCSVDNLLHSTRRRYVLRRQTSTHVMFTEHSTAIVGVSTMTQPKTRQVSDLGKAAGQPARFLRRKPALPLFENFSDEQRVKSYSHETTGTSSQLTRARIHLHPL